MNTIDEAIEVLQAMRDGKSIQVLHINDHWGDRVKSREDELPDFYNLDYRVKPEPREFWLNLYPSGSACRHETFEEASRNISDPHGITIKVREVIE